MRTRLLLLALLASTSSASRALAQGCVPAAEVCDGIDNDCDDAIDDPPFADAPAAGQEGCWSLPGNCCSHASLAWCPPPGATCSSRGGLAGACAAGTLRCSGGAWACDGAVGPMPETCDGVDNDCDDSVDDGVLPGVGSVCSSGLGLCETAGVSMCTEGALMCSAVPPDASVELCGTGLDEDCDGDTDEGFVLGESCTVGLGACTAAGVTVCDGAGTRCDATAGTPAVSELCGDGVDDDCNGAVDDGCAVDAGMGQDAGLADDAGATTDGGALLDGGADLDASATPDASPQSDAGFDAGTGGGDAATGCGCRAAGSGSSSGPMVSALGVLALSAVRRRRRAHGR